MEQFTEPVKGQNDGRETAATHGSHKFQVPLNVRKAIRW